MLAPIARSAQRKTLDIYVVDVEGGNATLFVAPSGESLLIDTGNGGAAAARDADRIMAAAKDAGLTQIDHLITTHWHGDHFGGMAELAARIPIREFIDHGAERPAGRRPPTNSCRRSIRRSTRKATHTVAKPGDRIAIAGLDWRIVASAGAGDQDAAARRRAGRIRPARLQAAGRRIRPRTRSRSAASSRSGSFRVAHLGDLTWNKEFDLMCPTNRIGTVDLFIVSHHGQPISNSPRCSCTRCSRASPS